MTTPESDNRKGEAQPSSSNIGNNTNTATASAAGANPYPPYPYAGYPPPHPYYNPGAGSHPAYYPPPPPYAVPPPPPPSFCLRCVCPILAATIIFISIYLLLFSIIVNPRLPNFSITSASFSNLNASSATGFISLDVYVTISVTNPNKKMEIKYTSIDVSVAYKKVVITGTHVQPFDQGVGSKTSFQARFVAVDTFIGRNAAEEINGEKQGGGGKVRIGIGVDTTAKFAAGEVWGTGVQLIRVLCDNVVIDFNGNSTLGGNVGTMVGPPVECRIVF